MKIKNAKFVSSFTDFNEQMPQMPKICVVGRSNVGKSSFLNMLMGAKLAKVSSVPGKTRLINLFNINDEFLLVDLPGYGYAKAGKSEIENFQKRAENFFSKTPDIVQTLLLVDCRHDASALDLAMAQYLFVLNLPFTIIATKCDKLSKSKLNANLIRLSAAFKVGINNIYPTSSQNRTGRDEVLQRLEEILKI